MTKAFLLICLLYVNVGTAQDIQHLDGKWAFTGLRTTVFKVLNGKLYMGMLEYADTANFNRFMQRQPLDTSVYIPATVSQSSDTIRINAKFPLIDHELKLHYLPKDSTHIWFTGDVYIDSTRVIVPNNNCNLQNPACINRLYNQTDLGAIISLKTSEQFSRDDAFEFLLRLNEKLKSRCNKCFAGFTDAYMNEVLIEMGYNPIVKRTAVRSVWYNTSGFTFYLKMKFADDERIVKLIDYIFEWYLK